MYVNYEFVVVPFGLTEAPNNFMCLMNSMLHTYLENFVILFIKDIFIYSKNEEDHVEHLAKILILIRDHQLYTNLSKCSFFQTWVHYLGHVVSKEGIIAYLEMIRAIMECEAPRNVDEVRTFMGLESYYISFIENL